MIIDLQTAANLISEGHVVAFPTETVYGLGADAKNIMAIKKTFELKGRPSDNPLIVHVCSVNQAEEITQNLPEDFYKLAENFWPGPLSIIVEKNQSVPDAVTAGLNTVAVRMPDHPLALKLIQLTGPLTAPSANKSGKPSPTKPAHLVQDYGDTLPILNGGNTRIGLESTILDLTSEQPEILRPGAITALEIQNVLNRKVQDFREIQTDISKPAKSPGIKYTHYKPEAEVNWFDEFPLIPKNDAIYVVHSKKNWVKSEQVLPYNENFTELAKDLYDIFRMADHLSFRRILIEQLPEPEEHRLITALKNRISKAIG
jgi:L-threonylcarbamoyladenylate synthase